MTFVILVVRHRHQQRLARPAELDQRPPLEQDVVLAVTVAIVGIGPAFDDALVIEIAQWLDRLVNPLVYAHQVDPRHP
jgi:hypothetical protein